MSRKIRHLKWTIEDHIKDAGYHLGFAIEDKESGDTRGMRDEILEGENRLQEAKKKLDEFLEYIKDCEYKDKQSGIEERHLKDKYSAWRIIHKMWAEDIEDMEEKFDDMN